MQIYPRFRTTSSCFSTNTKTDTSGYSGCLGFFACLQYTDLPVLRNAARPAKPGLWTHLGTEKRGRDCQNNARHLLLLSRLQLCDNLATGRPATNEVAMDSPARRPNHPLRALVISLGLHGVFFACVFLFGAQATIRILQAVRPQLVARISHSGGSHAIRIILPASRFAAHTPTPDAYADASKKTIIPMEVPPVKKSGGGSPRAPHHGDGAGKATFGNGSESEDVHPAFPVFSPHPPVSDRSLLPHLPEKIVVDVDVDASGQVVSEKLVKGLGTRLDQIVLETVRTWRFQPATINGKAVATEAELIFPFNQDYPIAES